MEFLGSGLLTNILLLLILYKGIPQWNGMMDTLHNMNKFLDDIERNTRT